MAVARLTLIVCSRGSAVYEPLVFIMRTYPEPIQDVALSDRKRSIRLIDAGAPQLADWLQVEGRMRRISTNSQNSLEACERNVTISCGTAEASD
jgi:hypothetical protein